MRATLIVLLLLVAAGQAGAEDAAEPDRVVRFEAPAGATWALAQLDVAPADVSADQRMTLDVSFSGLAPETLTYICILEVVELTTGRLVAPGMECDGFVSRAGSGGERLVRVGEPPSAFLVLAATSSPGFALLVRVAPGEPQPTAVDVARAQPLPLLASGAGARLTLGPNGATLDTRDDARVGELASVGWTRLRADHPLSGTNLQAYELHGRGPFVGHAELTRTRDGSTTTTRALGFPAARAAGVTSGEFSLELKLEGARSRDDLIFFSAATIPVDFEAAGFVVQRGGFGG